MSGERSNQRGDATRTGTKTHKRLKRYLESEVGQRTLFRSSRGEPVHIKKPGRNDPCPCGSGKKWKSCHGKEAA
jgi:uncharacterized protein YecA (UPF0149 family)